MRRGLLTALVLASSANAIAAPRDVTLIDALQAAGAAPVHQVAAAQQSEAAAASEAAGAWPSTALSASTSRLSPKLDLIASLPLPLFGTLAANRAVARDDFETAVAELRASDLNLARDVAAAWIALARAESRAALSQRSADRENELVHVTTERFEAGEASHADVVLATATAKRVGAQASADEMVIGSASAELAGLLGWDPAMTLHAAGGLPDPSAHAAPAVTTHPEQAAAARRAAAQAARVTEVRRANWPRLALDLESAIGDPTLPGTDYRVGLTIDLPLLGHTGENVRAAEARVATAQVAGAATAKKLGAELVAARSRNAAASAHAIALERDVVPAQREAADLERAAFREGQTGLAFVLEAERGLADAESDAIDARADAATSFIELEWASGVVR